MSKTVRLSQEVYSRLANLASGFESPSDTMLKILDSYEYSEAYDMLDKLISAKIQILKDEPELKFQEVAALLHYDRKSIKIAIEKIIEDNKSYNFDYRQDVNSIWVRIERA